jgi:hypothetical protein
MATPSMDGVVLWVTIHEHDMLTVGVEQMLPFLLSLFEGASPPRRCQSNEGFYVLLGQYG